MGLATKAIRSKLGVAGLIAGLVGEWLMPRCRGAAAGGSTRSKVANMERAVFVYTTYPSIVEAEQAGRALVEQHLCACVNILPGMISHYRWQGTIERGEEVVMIIKTRSSLTERVSTAVKKMHS